MYRAAERSPRSGLTAKPVCGNGQTLHPTRRTTWTRRPFARSYAARSLSWVTLPSFGVGEQGHALHRPRLHRHRESRPTLLVVMWCGRPPRGRPDGPVVSAVRQRDEHTQGSSFCPGSSRSAKTEPSAWTETGPPQSLSKVRRGRTWRLAWTRARYSSMSPLARSRKTSGRRVDVRHHVRLERRGVQVRFPALCRGQPTATARRLEGVGGHRAAVRREFHEPGRCRCLTGR